MSGTTSLDFLTISKICANSYGDNKDDNNQLNSSEWEKLYMVINNAKTNILYYGFDNISL